MSVVLPPPIGLPPPPESAPGLADLVATLTGAAFRAGVLEAHLSGPAAHAPEWLGADAAAAADQVGRTATLARGVHGALTAAENRLAAHHDLLADALGRIQALRRAQDEDYATASARLSALEARSGEYGLGDAAATAVLDDLEAAERSRARRHAEVLGEVAQDAADTVRALALSAEAVGGIGASGDGGRVLAFLARELPGWGAGELAALAAEGSALGTRLRRASPEQLVADLSDHRLMLAEPGFAVAFLRALGPETLCRFVQWAGLAVDPQLLPPMLGWLMGSAGGAADGDVTLRRTLDAPLDGPMDAFLAVGLGRVASAPGLTADYRSRLVLRLAEEERDQPWLRRDELEVAPADDPLAAALAALAAAQAPDAAAGVLADPELWPVLLGRTWTEGTAALEQLLAVAAAGPRLGGAAALAALDAIGDVTDVLVRGTGTGSPEDFVVLRISPAVGNLVAAHLADVTAPVVAAEGRLGVASVPLEEEARRRMAGLGMVTRDPQARDAVLWSLVRSMGEQLPDLRPGTPTPAAFATGGVFAAMAFGERESIRAGLYSDAERAAANAQAWTVLTSALGVLPAARLMALRDLVSTGLGFVGPGGVPIDDFLAQPATGAFQASFAAVAATVPRLVAAGALPSPGAALDHGLGSPEARAYVASLTLLQRDLWDRVVTGAEEGFLTVGDGLGIVPGSEPYG